MKRTTTLLLAAMFLAACAPARPSSTVPVPTPPARAEPEPAVTPEPAAGANGPAAAWWLASTDAAGTYGAGVERAYRELLAGRSPKQTVVVAVIDSGVDVEHDDLDGSLWLNEDEVAGNRRDDDGNGYVDDVHGWNFIGGPDGKPVEHDTFEVTRLVALCRQQSNGGTPSYAPAADECPAIEAAFRERVDKYRQMQAQLQGMNAALRQFVALLREQLNGDSLTVTTVERLRPLRNDVRQAQSAYLQLASMGYTPDDIAEELADVTGMVEYGLNPSFDPRPIVGDNYADPTERVYGNAGVTGPDASHGTGVAGIIGAERGNGLGEDGIAPAVRIMVLRAVPDGDERDKDVANAIRYAADNGARVINMSFGKSHSPFKQVVDEAVKYATSKGVLLVHAAGNDAADLAHESNFPNATYLGGGESENWLEVGASGWKGAAVLAAEFSNYGAQQVDIFAPGVDIHTTDVKQTWQRNSGTSFAAPVVSGVAALIMAYYPELGARAVKQIILDSATPLREQLVVRPGTPGDRVRFGALSRTGALVNAYEALKLAAQRAATAPQ